jgi:hypothetical protein
MKTFKKFIKDEAPIMSISTGSVEGLTGIPPIRKNIKSAILKRKKPAVNEKP